MRTMLFFTLACLLTCFATPLLAQDQDQEFIFNTWSLNKDDSRYIFADTALVRVSPDTKQAAIDTLLAGDDITAVSILPGKMLTLKGLTLPWVQIKYNKNGVEKEGYVWEGLISFTPMRRGDMKFIFAYDRRMDTLIGQRKQSQYIVKLKAVQAGKILASTSFRIFDDESAGFAYAKVMGGIGLTNVQHIVSLGFGGAACGVPTNYYYFAWMKDGRLAPLPGRMDVGDAGVYYHEESFIFPGEKDGQPDIIVLKMHEEEETDKVDKNGEPVMAVKEASTKYSWDGVNGTYRKIGK
ncbi:SH3 domain-containing protein [Chitinophaga sp.]|uniref:SH3 domain-containing protein n=1 Tax=Chitinophaga sp. TaxID=1869181 RepID=UPI002F954A83